MPTRAEFPDPRHMSSDARRAEVAAILAEGARRMLAGVSIVPITAEPESGRGRLEASESGGRDLTGPGVSTPETEGRP